MALFVTIVQALWALGGALAFAVVGQVVVQEMVERRPR